MTCIVGFKEDNVLYMASDRMVSDAAGNTYSPKTGPKCVKKGVVLMGFSGSLEICELFGAHFVLPIDIIHKQFFPEVSKKIETVIGRFLKKHKLTNYKKRYVLSDNKAISILIGINTGFYKYNIDQYGLNLQSHHESFGQAGSGGSFALGALIGLSEGKRFTTQIHKAMKIAAQLDPYSDDNIDIIST